ncbi:hypothetical protein JTE90_016368 [Oedothorax gibbosus]|uniref:Gustatory receptor n=1 Tax=Oedothorax gibbosus TaxID=931172 RepID=A0AAV6U8E4_9ARAC|nr:hypothetical protein JTE90_016368 [Oedothorax gibbosus]
MQISSYRVFCSLNHSFENILQSKRLSKNDLTRITSEFQKASKVVKTANDCMSPIAFALIAFYAFDISYVISKLVVAPRNYFGYFRSVCHIMQFLVHFVMLVLTSSYVKAEMLKTQNMVLRANLEDPAQILLSTFLLDSCRKESVLKPMGVFKLEERFILVFIGVIVSYEVMILPYLSSTAMSH